MKIRLLRATTINKDDFDPPAEDSRSVEEGDVISVTRQCAELLIGIKKAKGYYEEGKPIETAEATPPEAAVAPRARKRTGLDG